MNINTYELEILTLQKKDTENALASGYKTKKEWYDFIIKQDTDEIADAILDIAKRYNLDAATVANTFDPSMVVRLGKRMNQKSKEMK